MNWSFEEDGHIVGLDVEQVMPNDGGENSELVVDIHDTFMSNLCISRFEKYFAYTNFMDTSITLYSTTTRWRLYREKKCAIEGFWVAN